MTGLIEPKEMLIDGKTFIFSKFPAIAGREIIANYPLSGMPKLGDYKVNEETMVKLMNYVAVYLDGGSSQLRLSNRALIDNHVSSWETLAKIEVGMLEYNCSFLQNGRVSTLLNDIAQKIPTWISKISTAFLAQLSQMGKQP